MAHINSIICLLACCTLMGCSAISFSEKPLMVEPVVCVTPDLQANKPLLLTQNIHAKYLDASDQSTQREVTFDAYLASNNRELKLSVLFMGFRAWDITYDGEMIFEERTSQVPQELQANYLLRDITLSYWPASNIMRQSPKLLIVDKPHERLIQDRESGDLLLSIHYMDNAGPTSPIGRLILTNHKEHYQLSIDSREP